MGRPAKAEGLAYLFLWAVQTRIDTGAEKCTYGVHAKILGAIAKYSTSLRPGRACTRRVKSRSVVLLRISLPLVLEYVELVKKRLLLLEISKIPS